MDALRTLAASLPAGVCQLWHARGGPAGYGPNVDSPVFGTGQNISQGTKCQWDPTPVRAYGNYQVVGGMDTWVGYRVNNAAGYPIGTSTIAVDSGVKPILAEHWISFKGVSGKYTISAGGGLPAGGSGTITFSPALQEAVTDNLEIRLHKYGQRILSWGHAHTASSNSWPSWTCWTADSDQWLTLPYYRQLALSATDPTMEAIIAGNFHQDGGTTIDAANQVFYRTLPGGNPTIISRVDIGEYDPQDIGRFTDFALSGTLTFTSGSNLVTKVGGASFLTQLPLRGGTGYQIWVNGLDMFNGVSMRIMTVAAVTGADTLTLVHNWTPGTQSSSSCSAHDAYAMTSHWGFEPGGTQMAGPNNAAGTELWPDRDVLVWADFRTNSCVLYEKRTGLGHTAAWTVLKDISAAFDLTSGGVRNGGSLTGTIHYNTKRRSLFILVGVKLVSDTFGADGNEGAELFELKLNSFDAPQGATTLTRLDRFPFPIYTNNVTGGPVAHCPVSGKYLLWSGPYDPVTYALIPDTPRRFAELDPDATLGAQITWLDGSIFPPGMSNDIALNQTQQLECCVAYNYGVIVFMGGNNSYVYKHTANDWALNGMPSAQIEAGPGIQGNFQFGNGWVPKYTWDTANAAIDPALAAAVSGLTYYYGDQFNIAIKCYSAHPTVPRTDGGDGVGLPVISTTVKYKDQGGSLEFVAKNQTGYGGGELQANIDNTTSDASTPHGVMINPMPAARSRYLAYRFPIRCNAATLANERESTPTGIFWGQGCSTPAINSTTVNLATGGADATWVNRDVYIGWVNGQNWRYGFYHITAFNSSTQIVLNESPTFSGFQGFSGNIYIQPDPGSESSSTKIFILHGNTPYGFSSSQSIETTLTHLGRPTTEPLVNYISPYGQMGAQSNIKTQGFGGPLLADTFHLVDVETQFRPTATDFYTESAGSLVIKSASFLFTTAMVTFGSSIYFDGVGTRAGVFDYAVNASPWVPGLYQVVSVNTVDNSATLNSSPTPSAAGIRGHGHFSASSAGGLTASKNLLRLWIDGMLAGEYFDNRVDFASVAQPYGYGRVSISANANYRDVTEVHAARHTWIGHVSFSIQPLADNIATIAESLTASCAPATTGTVGVAYSSSIGVSGGTAPYTFAVTSGTLPAGLSLHSSTGLISGTPTTVGAYSFVVTVTDAVAATDATPSCGITISTGATVEKKLFPMLGRK